MTSSLELPAVAITDCSVEGGDTLYALACSGSTLRIRVCARHGEPSVDAASRWRVEARAGTEADAVIVLACGPTRVDALLAVAQWWSSQEVPLQLARFDWSAIVRLLVSAGV